MDKIKTNCNDPKRAMEDLAKKLNENGFLKDLGDHVTMISDGGHYRLGFDFAFEAALGFLDGTGTHGYEGFGPCGPVFDEENSGVYLEAFDSVTVEIVKLPF